MYKYKNGDNYSKAWIKKDDYWWVYPPIIYDQPANVIALSYKCRSFTTFQEAVDYFKEQTCLLRSQTSGQEKK